MKTALILFTVLFFSTSFSVNYCKSKKELFACQLLVKYNGKYCGGARPSQEMLDEFAQPKSLVNSTIKIFPVGKKKPIVKCTSDALGKCSLKLPVGEYNYSLTSNIDKSILFINKKCTKAINKVYGTFKVDKVATNDIELLFHFDCDPCDPNSKRRQ